MIDEESTEVALVEAIKSMEDFEKEHGVIQADTLLILESNRGSIS